MEIIPYLLAKINLHWNLSFGYPSSRKCPHPSKFTKQEKTKKAYTVDRLSDHLKDGINVSAMDAYLNYV